MSQYSIEIQRAKSRQRKFYIVIATSLAMIGLVIMLGLGLGLMRSSAIVIFPEEARNHASLYLEKGSGFTLLGNVYSFSAEVSVLVAASGFKMVTHRFSPREDGSRIAVTLEPLPGKISAHNNVSDPDTRWYVDGKLISLSPDFSVELEAGTHRLLIDNPYHEPQELDVKLIRGEEKLLNFNLKPILGKLEIASTPAGAQVKVNAETVGQTPLILARSGGVYHVEVSSPDHETVFDDIEISNRKSHPSRNYRLEAKKGYLVISLSPNNGVLLVDGKKVSFLDRLKLEANKPHRLSYQKAGYFTETARIHLASGEEKILAIKLRPEKGKVEVVSRPKAEVWINSKPVGMTPVSIDLPAVAQKIELVRLGYRSYEKQVIPSSKATKKIDVVLKSEMQARLEQTKTHFTNESGMKFKLFKPGGISLGAPRHEKGQRANEFQRDIILQKPFFISLHEVTNSQYSQFKKGGAGAGNLPVTSINWEDAAAFCNWLSKKEGLSPFYLFSKGNYLGFNATSDGYRLPSEAEWEWLARKAGKMKQSKFVWGDDQVIPPNSGNFADETVRGKAKFYVPNYNDGFAKLAPVGSYAADKIGLFDLAGNVSEWVHDFYSLVPPRQNGVEYDPLGAKVGSNHVVKGANWNSGTLTELRASFREGMLGGREDIGFRVARYLYGAVNE
ncbi:MAG: SUMF1/EgtB/PvdO family nonheme iron enzyme [Amphritea sp.]